MRNTLFLASKTFPRQFWRLLLFMFCAPWTASTDAAVALKLSGFQKADVYTSDLLSLVLSALDQPYELQFSQQASNRKRVELMLEKGDIDVSWFPANQELEDKYIALKYPIYMGLTSYRFPLVKRVRQEQMQNVKTINDLKTRFVGGSGRFWSTTKIYQANGFRLVTAVKKPGLFHMLEGERFDYFLRGVNEVKRELKEYSNLDLIIDPSVVVLAPNASYLFVSPTRPDLAAELDKGFRRLIASGEYHAFVKQSHLYKDLSSIFKEKKRRILLLQNNSYKIPINNPDLWIDISEMTTL